MQICKQIKILVISHDSNKQRNANAHTVILSLIKIITHCKQLIFIDYAVNKSLG